MRYFEKMEGRNYLIEKEIKVIEGEEVCTPRNRIIILFSITILISTIFLSFYLYNDIINFIISKN